MYNSAAKVIYDDTGKFAAVSVNKGKDLATATAFTYHHYVAGSSHLFMGTAAFVNAGIVGDSPEGFANGVAIRFGAFDARNGFMFLLGPDGVLYLERRNNNSGTVVSNLLACSDATTATALGIDRFNGDLVDGSKGSTNASGMKLNLSKNNQYWIDLQWHGAGRARFGTFHNGRRVVIHEYYHNNRYDLPMNQTASLPTCTAMYAYTQPEIDSNWPVASHPYAVAKTNGVDITTRVFSQAMWTETDIDLQSIGTPKSYATGHIPVEGGAFKYLFSLRPNPRNPNGGTDNTLIIPTKIAAIAYDAAVTTAGQNREAIVHWRVSEQTVHHRHTWADIPGTQVQVSTTGINYETLESKNRLLEDMYIGRGEKDLTSTFIDFQNGAWKNRSDDGGTIDQNIATIVGSTTGTVTEATTSTGTTCNVDDTTGILIGASITGTDVAAATTVEAVVDGTTLTLNQDVVSATGSTLTWVNPVTVTMDTVDSVRDMSPAEALDDWKLTEPFIATFPPSIAQGNGKFRAKDFDGLTLSSNDVYLYITGQTTGVLYADENFTTPITSTGSYSGGSASIMGYIGPAYVISFYAHEQPDGSDQFYQDVRAMFAIEWKEIEQ